ELTKRFEEFVRGTVEELMDWAKKTELKGEFCLVIEGNKNVFEDTEEMWWSHLSVKDHVTYYVQEQSLSSKEAIKLVMKERNMPKREVYSAYHLGNYFSAVSYLLSLG